VLKKDLYHVEIEGSRPDFNYVQVYAVNEKEAKRTAKRLKNVIKVKSVKKLS